MAFQGAFESAFFLLLCLFLLDGATKISARFWGASLCAFLSAFSFGNGLLTLPIGFLLIACKCWLEGKDVLPKRFSVLFAWTIVSVLIVAIYFFHFSPAVGQGKVTPEFLVHSPPKVLAFVLGFVAAPVAHEEQSAMLMGAVFFILCLILLVGLASKPKAFTEDMVLPAMLVCYAVLSGCMAAYGRAQMGIEASFVSRYATMANYGWIGLYLLLLFGKDLARDLRLTLLSTTFVCLTIGAIMTAMFFRLDGLFYRDIELKVENAIRSYALVGPKCLTEWTGVNAPDVIPLIEFLKENRLSLFARSKPPECEQAVLWSHVLLPYWAQIDYAGGQLASGANGITTVYLDPAKDTDVTLKGWVADVKARSLPRAVCVLIDGKMVPSVYPLTRYDIARGLKQDYLLCSGFAAEYRTNLLSSGNHVVSLKIVREDGRFSYETPALLHLRVK